MGSNSMTHGLAARSVVAARAVEVKTLAGLLASHLPQSPPVQEAAIELADAIFALHAIRRSRTDLLTPPVTGASIDDVEQLLDHLLRFDSYSKEEKLIVGREYEEEYDSDTRQQTLLLKAYKQNKHKLTILDDYERRVHSRYLKLVTRLDYLGIEARRKK